MPTLRQIIVFVSGLSISCPLNHVPDIRNLLLPPGVGEVN